MFTIDDAGPTLPIDLAALAEAADREGIRIVATVIERWIDGTQRYDAPGESMLIARADDRAVAVGGLAQCPNVTGALRMRRFYVAPAWRRHGVARALAQRLIDRSSQYTDTLTCNAQASASAPPFWESLGFIVVDDAGITHVRHGGGSTFQQSSRMS